jgi:hypothetical protein
MRSAVEYHYFINRWLIIKVVGGWWLVVGHVLVGKGLARS